MCLLRMLLRKMCKQLSPQQGMQAKNTAKQNTSDIENCSHSNGHYSFLILSDDACAHLKPRKNRAWRGFSLPVQISHRMMPRDQMSAL